MVLTQTKSINFYPASIAKTKLPNPLKQLEKKHRSGLHKFCMKKEKEGATISNHFFIRKLLRSD
jgi:hypothetical protein